MILLTIFGSSNPTQWVYLYIISITILTCFFSWVEKNLVYNIYFGTEHKKFNWQL